MAADARWIDVSIALLTRLTEALERLAPPPPAAGGPGRGGCVRLAPLAGASGAGAAWCRGSTIGLLKGVERQKGILLENTLRFVRGLPANNAMLWGARGMGKSSLVKAMHAEANGEMPGCLVLIEIHREDIRSLPVAAEPAARPGRGAA